MHVAAKTPADLTITPRDRRFGRGMRTERWWMGGDPIATALYNALSENGNPTLETLVGVLNALGLQLTVQKRAA